MVVVDGQGIPLGSQLASASPAEVTLCESTLACVPARPKQIRRLIVDRGYDSDPLRHRLKARGIQMICPHRYNRIKPSTQDGRALRRYRHRWKIERTFAWLGNWRRLTVRYERSLVVYKAFFHIACVLITLKHF